MLSPSQIPVLSLIASRLKNRKDSEHVQAMIRVAMTGVVSLYLNSGLGNRTPMAAWGDTLSIVYFGISIFVLGWIVVLPGESPLRRYIAMVGEHLFVSLGLMLEGERAAPLFLIYIWVSLGNGFRYGLSALISSTLISTAGFVCVIAYSSFWRSQLPISIGIVLAMIAIPLYAASLIRQLRAAKSAAEEASHAKSRFLATASHELRTPLHAIIGLSELLQQSNLNPEQREMVQTVRGSGRALLSLVEDVLDLSSIQAGREVSASQPFNLHQAIGETIAIARPQAGQKGIDLAVRIAADVPAALNGDWPHLRQILLNLLTNAIKFTDKGQVCLTVDVTTISPASTTLSLAISDTGIGIAQKDLDRIFETFGQANNSSTRKYGGVGLGLAIVRQLADLLHGTVSVSSTLGSGSVFTVQLPFDRQADSAEIAMNATVMVHSQDAALLPQLRRLLPEIAFAVPTADIPDGTTTIIELIDGRGNASGIDQLSREIAQRHRGIASASIALGVDAWDIERMAPSIVGCIPELDATTLRGGLKIAATLATHHERETALQSERELMAVQAFQPDETVMANGVRALVVDDSPVNRMVTQKILKSAGYEVSLADGADQALELLADEDFGIVLLDLNMPGTSGVDIIKLFKVMRLGMETPPIVIFSADVTGEARAECLELGVSLFLPKPSEPWFILQQLAELVPHDIVTVEETPAAVVEQSEEPVVPISSHPLYKPTPELGIIDRHALQSLASLDTDRSFLTDLIAAFEADTVDVLEMIDRSVRDNDMRLFWDQVHAMRSSAANVGAKQILAACLEINGEGKMSFHKRGFEYAARLRYEFNRFQRTMDRFLSVQAKAH